MAEELRRTGVAHRIFAGHVRFQYRRALSMLLFGYPRLAWFAARSAVRSMFLSTPRPDVVVLGSDVEVLVFALLRVLRGRSAPKIALTGFIYTARPSPLLRALRRRYFALVLRSVRCVVCHSTLEVERYREKDPALQSKLPSHPQRYTGSGVHPRRFDHVNILVDDVRSKLEMIPTVAEADVELVFDPPWNQHMMSEAARLETGML